MNSKINRVIGSFLLLSLVSVFSQIPGCDPRYSENDIAEIKAKAVNDFLSAKDPFSISDRWSRSSCDMYLYKVFSRDELKAFESIDGPDRCFSLPLQDPPSEPDFEGP